MEGTVPQRLKPRGTSRSCGTAEAVPFQERLFSRAVKAVPFQRCLFPPMKPCPSSGVFFPIKTCASAKGFSAACQALTALARSLYPHKLIRLPVYGFAGARVNQGRFLLKVFDHYLGIQNEMVR